MCNDTQTFLLSTNRRARIMRIKEEVKGAEMNG